ncbi:MAG: ABC transporter substrate-binding protein [Clostridiales bacterium]|nr:ABC transporter substrate-binding protein [Clostridiales bacterium]
MKLKKLVVILLCLVMILPILFACNGTTDNTPSTTASPGAPTSAPEQPSSDIKPPATEVTRDTLTIAVDNDDGSLSPAHLTGGLYTAMECIFEPLWDFTEDGELIPVLMESYEVTAEDCWRIKLRQGVTFSNGNVFNADDVIFSLKFWKTVGVNAVRVQSIDDTRTVKIDDYTIDLYQPYFYVMHNTAASMFMIYDEESFDENKFALNPIGTGPYVVKDYVTNSHLFLERRDDYWGTAPDVQFLNFRVMAEPAQVVNGLSTNDLDVGRIQLSDYAYIDSLDGFNIHSQARGGGVQLWFNSGHKGAFTFIDKDPQKVREMRYAIFHAIDPQAIIDLLYEGRGRLMYCQAPDFCQDFEPAFNKLTSTYAEGYNVELAQQYADSSGLTGATVTMMTNGLPTMVNLAEILQNMLDKIGVTVVINNTDPATFNTEQYSKEAEYDIRVGEGIAPNWRVADALVNGVRYSEALTVPGAFPDNDYNLELAPKTISTFDDAQRREYLLETLTKFQEEAIGYSLCMYDTSYTVTSDVDFNSIRFNLCSGYIRYKDIKWAS